MLCLRFGLTCRAAADPRGGRPALRPHPRAHPSDRSEGAHQAAPPLPARAPAHPGHARRLTARYAGSGPGRRRQAGARQRLDRLGGLPLQVGQLGQARTIRPRRSRPSSGRASSASASRSGLARYTMSIRFGVASTTTAGSDTSFTSRPTSSKISRRAASDGCSRRCNRPPGKPQCRPVRLPDQQHATVGALDDARSRRPRTSG